MSCLEVPSRVTKAWAVDLGKSRTVGEFGTQKNGLAACSLGSHMNQQVRTEKTKAGA